ncbi:MAG: type III secretion inner membrane ring lipoprotein SctJ [Comamonadaceae bacterium]|nr:type III secretion inner membrane ring lipoprotein SctJ [Comamonadaceae bacterium]
MTLGRTILAPTSNGGLRHLLHVAILCACVLLAACSGRVDLMGAIPEDEANEVLGALLKADISANKVAGKDGMVAIRVDGPQVSRALQVLRENGLPRERYAGMGQVFKKEGLISSPLEERARYIYALSQEISGTLSKIDGVLYARVHVVLPERGAAGESGTLSTAAVFMKHQEGYDLELLQPQIRRLVTNSIPGLAPERVSIVFVAANPSSTEIAAASNVRWLGFDVGADSASGLSTLVWTLAALVTMAFLAIAALLWVYVLPRGRTLPQKKEAIA